MAGTSPTFLDLATDAMTRIGELGQGETMSPEDANFCLTVCNSMLDIWSTQRDMIFTVTNLTENLTANTQDYTIGPSGATFTNARPILIQTAAMVMPGTTVREPMSILTSKMWSALKEKGLVGVLPDKIYLDQGYPNAGFHVHPIPSGVIEIDLYYWGELTQFASITTTFSFPPGYYECMVQNLALRIMPGYGKVPDQVTAEAAAASLANIKAINAQILNGALMPPIGPNIGEVMAPAAPQGAPTR